MLLWKKMLLLCFVVFQVHWKLQQCTKFTFLFELLLSSILGTNILFFCLVLQLLNWNLDAQTSKTKSLTEFKGPLPDLCIWTINYSLQSICSVSVYVYSSWKYWDFFELCLCLKINKAIFFRFAFSFFFLVQSFSIWFVFFLSYQL